MIGHEDVPYWCAFVRSEDGSQSIVKLDHTAEVGAALSFGEAERAILQVAGVMGTGTMVRSLTAESVDDAIRLGLNHPMGPLALADLIGLDVVMDIMNNLAERTGDDTYAPQPPLCEMVETGNLDRKTGAGFYQYPRRTG